MSSNTQILKCEGDSKWTFFDGNYQEYEADKRRRLGDNQPACVVGALAPYNHGAPLAGVLNERCVLA